MGLPVGEIQTAAITRLRADVTLQGLLTGAVSPRWSIFDPGGVPTNQAFPYMTVFEITGKTGTALAMGKDATDVYLQLSVFDQNFGFSRARTIAKQAYSDLQENALSLANNFVNFFILFDNYQELMEADGLTSHIAIRMKTMNQG